MFTVKDIQQALIKAGFAVGKSGADGIMGRDTQNAIKLFQRANDLGQTGVADERTLRHLFPGMAKPLGDVAVELPWYGEALRLKGLKEGAGKADNSTIMGWAKRLMQKAFTADSVAWCGLYVAHCISYALPNEALPANPLGARNWLKFGVPLKTPSKGAIVVFWRGSLKGWSGHVGFYVGEDATAIHVLGGNQSDAVTITRIAKSRLLGYRWPSKVPLPTGGAVKLTASGGLSTNEA